MGTNKKLRQEQLDTLLFNYAECKIEWDEYLSGITALGIQSPSEIDEYKDKAEEARYDYKVSQYQAKY